MYLCYKNGKYTSMHSSLNTNGLLEHDSQIRKFSSMALSFTNKTDRNSLKKGKYKGIILNENLAEVMLFIFLLNRY